MFSKSAPEEWSRVVFLKSAPLFLYSARNVPLVRTKCSNDSHQRLGNYLHFEVLEEAIIIIRLSIIIK